MNDVYASDLDYEYEGVLDLEALMILDLVGHQIEDPHVVASVLVKAGWSRTL